MPDINDLISDEDFQKLPTDKQQKAIMQFVAANGSTPDTSQRQAVLSRLPESMAPEDRLAFENQQSLALHPPRYPNGQPSHVNEFLDKIINAEHTSPDGKSRKIIDMVHGGLLGTLLNGGPGIGTVIGAYTDPKSAGDWASTLAAPALGSLGAGFANAAESPAGQVARNGVMGLLNYLGLNTINEGANAIGNKVGNQNIPLHNPLPTTPSDLVQAGASTAMPMMDNILSKQMVEGRPISQAFKFAQEHSRNVQNLSDMSNLVKPNIRTPEAEAMRKAGLTLPPEQQALLAQQNTLQEQRTQKDLGNKNLDVQSKKLALRQKEFETMNAHVEELRRQEELKLGLTNDPQVKANLQNFENQQQNYKTNKTVLGEQKANIDLEKAKGTEEVGHLDQALKNLQEKANSLDALNPGLSTLAKNSPTTTELTDNIMKAPPETVATFRANLKTQPDSTKNLGEFQDNMVDKFFALSYSPQTKELTNAPNLMKADGPFNHDKIKAIFGDTADAELKANTFEKTVNGIIASQNKNSLMQNLVRYAGMHTIWVLPNMLLFHPETLTNAAAAGAGVAISGIAAISYPKMIDAFLKNPAYADSFYKWTTGKDSVSRSLASYPRLFAWMKANADPIDTEELKKKANLFGK